MEDLYSSLLKTAALLINNTSFYPNKTLFCNSQETSFPIVQPFCQRIRSVQFYTGFTLIAFETKKRPFFFRNLRTSRQDNWFTFAPGIYIFYMKIKRKKVAFVWEHGPQYISLVGWLINVVEISKCVQWNLNKELYCAAAFI